MVTLTVDDRQIETATGTSLLKTCLDNGIYIPNLCYLEQSSPAAASCRLCFVEIENEDEPVAACTVCVEHPIRVKTDTAKVRRLQKSALQLLLSVHRVDCKNCPANRHCGLQDIARFLKVGLKPGRLQSQFKEPEIDDRHPQLNHYPNRCVLCGKCIEICRANSGKAALTFTGRGFQTIIGSFGSSGDNSAECQQCQACAAICPVGALVMKNS